MTFLDTNLVVYANDTRDPKKQDRALEVITQHLIAGTGVISTQVLQEYASVARTKLGQSVAVITHQLHLLESFRLVVLEPPLIRRALEIHELYRVSYWDAQILAAAEAAGCHQLLSEDLNPGQFYVGLTCQNPFS